MGSLQEQRRGEGNDQRGTGRMEGLTEGQDEGLLLRHSTYGGPAAPQGVGPVDRAVE
ncbi:hypothetical protein [Bradyrhizobium sp.]|uniref:hypothetical protein n=1 Tax=Bradyrhizobium sp. TaxID=376 RepID=UPI003C4AD192